MESYKKYNNIINFYKKLFAEEVELPRKSKQKLNSTSKQQEKFKEDVTEYIYKNENSMKTTELENILKSKVSSNKIQNFRKAVKNKETVKKFFSIITK